MAGSHEAIGWLRSDSDFALPAAAVRLAQQLQKAKVAEFSQRLRVSFGRWEVWVHMVEEEHVAEEAREFAGIYPDDERARHVADCIRRFEVECPNEDPHGRHRKDFLAVCAVLAQFQGVILRDPVEGIWLV
jgi:hypothetical protein